MGLDMDLEFDKYCRLDWSPTTVLLSPRHHSKVEKRITKGKPTCGNDRFSLKEDFTEINFHCYRSSSCKSIPSRTFGLEGNEVLKRGSVYQSSKKVRKVKKLGAVEGRRKIELSLSSATTLSFGIVDSLCSSDEDSLLMDHMRSSVKSLNPDLNTTTVSEPHIEPCSQDFLDLSVHHGRDSVFSSNCFSEISPNLNNRENQSTENVERETIEDPKLRCDPTAVSLNDGNVLRERDNALTLHKPLSAKLALHNSPSQSEMNCSRDSSPKARFSPIRKMFDPFTKSKSYRSPLGSVNESDDLASSGLASIRRNKTFRKSLLHDFSNTSQNSEFCSQFVSKNPNNSDVPCSPAHLHGRLKLENKHGVPFFEFSLKFPEDLLVAKIWKADNTLHWVYTFHSVQNRRKSNASGWGLKDSKKGSSMVGQMQVSCYLCTELKDAGLFDNSMVTEFVLYDIAHARKSIDAQENYNHSPDGKHPKGSNESSLGGIRELDEVSDQLKLKLQPKDPHDNGHFNSTPHPWAPANLHPNLEVAAIVIQVPFEKGENLKSKRGDVKSDQPHQNLLDLSVAEQRKKHVSDCLSPAKVNVITPSGNHGLPSSKSRGPSPLLDRWRLGGGCDCGGWDMACPLNVFGNPNIQSAEDHPLMENQQHLKLLVQGAKENTPALTITVIEEGLYAVDFHAQLSTLQAFSICVAILHGTEASITLGRERDKQLLQCNSLRVFIEEEVKYLIEEVTEEEKRKLGQKMEETPPSFVLNPPFSPIARV